MKKFVAVLLACVLLTGLVSANAAEPGKYDSLTVGVTTPFTGNFLDDALGSNLADQDVRALIHGYDLTLRIADADKIEVTGATENEIESAESAAQGSASGGAKDEEKNQIHNQKRMMPIK